MEEKDRAGRTEGRRGALLKKMRSGAGYENGLHSDPWSSAPGLSYNTFHWGGEGDMVHGKTKKEREMKLNKKSGGGEREEM